jgi:hypothetical protein
LQHGYLRVVKLVAAFVLVPEIMIVDSGLPIGSAYAAGDDAPASPAPARELSCEPLSPSAARTALGATANAANKNIAPSRLHQRVICDLA